MTVRRPQYPSLVRSGAGTDGHYPSLTPNVPSSGRYYAAVVVPCTLLCVTTRLRYVTMRYYLVTIRYYALLPGHYTLLSVTTFSLIEH